MNGCFVIVIVISTINRRRKVKAKETLSFPCSRKPCSECFHKNNGRKLRPTMVSVSVHSHYIPSVDNSDVSLISATEMAIYENAMDFLVTPPSTWSMNLNTFRRWRTSREDRFTLKYVTCDVTRDTNSGNTRTLLIFNFKSNDILYLYLYTTSVSGATRTTCRNHNLNFC